MDPTKGTSASPHVTQDGKRHTTGGARPPLTRSETGSLLALAVRSVKTAQRSTSTQPGRLPTVSQPPSAVPTDSMLNTLATGGTQPTSNVHTTTQGQRHPVG